MEQKKSSQAKKSSQTKKSGKAVKPEKKENLEITRWDQYLFGQGVHYEIYKKLGAHLTERDGEKGAYFAVWAPRAKSVALVGDFNQWNGQGFQMTRQEPLGVYDCFVPGVKEGMMYKFLIEGADGIMHYKADPFANYAELRPGSASKVADISYSWKDNKWMDERNQKDMETEPISIYEIHPGSWKKHPHEEGEDGFLSYDEMAKELVTYVKSMGYTHVELMGIAEHPFDGSWGYQVTGYYAPTSRYGTPKQFKHLVELFHKNNIGVILDWVPAHFPKDEHGLANFDGAPLYEYPDPRMGEHPDWGTKIFNYGMNEVKNFLIANALFWIEEYHVDGLRVDAVASMLYLDYGKKDGEWVANKYGGNKNLEAIEFFKHMNSCLLGRNPGVMMIAEESTAWPKVTGRPEDDGLGFCFKWNMGWMHDFLEYMKLDPIYRKGSHNKMTFAITYATSEKYILVLSHDEVVHLKCSMINKMPGLVDDKFANLKAGYTFMIGHPGKKLLFMGQEFGQFQEWSEERELDWYLLGDKQHEYLQTYVKKLLHIYKRHAALYELDASYEGFSWVNANDAQRSIFSFIRYSAQQKKGLLFVINFTPVAREDYAVGVPKKKQYKLLLNSHDPEFGGNDRREPIFKAKDGECDGQPYRLEYPLPPYGTAIFEF